MAEWAAKQAVGASSDTQIHHYNTVLREGDTNNGDFGEQHFVYKKILDAGVATSVGSPVGSLKAAGAATVTPDISDTDAGAIRGLGGGLSTIAVAAGTTAYGWVQFFGLNRYDAKAGSGTITAGEFILWSDDDVLNDIGATTEEDAFAYAYVTKDADNLIQNGNLLLLG